MTSVHPEESKEEAGVAGRVTDAITGAVNGAALVVLGEDLDGTAGGNLAKPAASQASQSKRKQSTYFEPFTSASDLGEFGPVYKNVYAECIRIFHAGPIALFFIGIFVVQVIMAIACLGLGLPGNTYANGIGVMLGTYGAMCSTWVQGVHPGCVRPNSYAFWVTGLLYMASYGTAYWLKYKDYQPPPVDDDVLEDYDYPFQPDVILWDFVMKVVLTIFWANTVMFKGHMDNSSKVSRGAARGDFFRPRRFRVSRLPPPAPRSLAGRPRRARGRTPVDGQQD